MTVDCETSRRQLQSTADGEEGSSSSCCADCGNGDARAGIVRIATWANVAPALQQYLNVYTALNPDAGEIRLSVFPSLQELQVETVLDVKAQYQTGLYDGFVVPPLMLGDLLQHEGLAEMDDVLGELQWQDLLPYYRNQVAILDGVVRSIPLLAGNQMLLVFRKDYLDSAQLPTPTTWGEFIRVAAALHNKPLGENGDNIYGACMGRLSEAACQKRVDQRGGSCTSLSMTYLGMSLAPMTQVNGTATGWLFDDDVSQGMSPLINPTLDRLLIFVEQQLQFGAPDELERDSSLNLELFREGRCAMTVSADHPADLLRKENVGFVPVPGSHNFLAREAETVVACTPELCPNGNDVDGWGRVNRAPFGATDMIVGGVSAQASDTHQATVKKFFEFISSAKLNLNVSVREQPMTYTGIQSSNIPGYENVLRDLTESANVADPFRVPNAYGLLSDLDTRVYDYLVAGNFTPSNRRQLRQSVEQSWARTIQQRDGQFQAIPTSAFYERSLGTFSPAPPSDQYIELPLRLLGWSLGGISCMTSLFFALWVWKYRNERVVRASQPNFLWMLCAGTFVMAFSIFPYGVEDDIASDRTADMACMSAMWFYSLGYVITFSALFSKMWRMNRVSRNYVVDFQCFSLPFHSDRRSFASTDLPQFRDSATNQSGISGCARALLATFRIQLCHTLGVEHHGPGTMGARTHQRRRDHPEYGRGVYLRNLYIRKLPRLPWYHFGCKSGHLLDCSRPSLRVSKDLYGIFGKSLD
jgi:ABC-type glycerol-3-phosphate transport system substrate-binding protein